MPAPTDVLALHAGANPDGVAVIVDSSGGARPSSTTFGELNALVNQCAHALVDAGGRAGDRLVWCGPNSLEVLVTIHAARKLGMVAVPLSYRFTAEEMAYVIENSDATLVVVDAEQAESVMTATAPLDRVRAVLVYGGEAPAGARPWTEALAAQSTAEPPAPANASEAGAQMIYTSGTTGKPKGALRTRSDRSL